MRFQLTTNTFQEEGMMSILYESCPTATLKVLLKLTFQAERASNLNGRQKFVNFRETNLEL